MSETLTITGGYQGTTYGTQALATAHMQTRFGTAYTAWLALDDDDKKRTLIGASDFIDRQSWIAEADTFAERDALAVFPKAVYELAAMLAEDDTALDTGAELQSVTASPIAVTFRDRVAKHGASLVLPPIVAQLVGKYLATSASAELESASSDAENPFADADDYDRTEPY